MSSMKMRDDWSSIAGDTVVSVSVVGSVDQCFGKRVCPVKSRVDDIGCARSGCVVERTDDVRAW